MNERPLRRARPEEVHKDCKPNDYRGDCIPFDEANPSWWYLPPPGKGDSGVQSAGADWKDSDADRSEQKEVVQHKALVQLSANVNGSDHLTSGTQAAADYHFHYWIPDDVSCTTCTIQWAWKSANSCTPHSKRWWLMVGLMWMPGAVGHVHTRRALAHRTSSHPKRAAKNLQIVRTYQSVRLIPKTQHHSHSHHPRHQRHQHQHLCPLKIARAASPSANLHATMTLLSTSVGAHHVT